MKIQILAAILTCSMACVAETVSYSIPVLTVKANGREIISGSGNLSRCPFSFVVTTNTIPVKVSISEDVPSGAGNSLRASLWLAATTASMILNRDLAGTMVNFETTGYVDGPSAGSMFCLAVMSALEKRKFPDDFAMTGTIMVDGTIGAVGGVAEKMKAAVKSGVKRVCIPSSVRLDEDYTDLIDLGKELGVEVHQVATISDAYQILHGLPAKQMDRLNPVEVCRLPPHIEDVLKQQYGSLCESCPQDESRSNNTLKRSVCELFSGLFGAAAMNIVKGLNEYCAASLFVQAPDSNAYPALVNEIPSDEAFSAGKFPSKAQYAAELMAYHRDLKNMEMRDADNGLCADNAVDQGDDRDEKSGKKPNDWFDDAVSSPSEAQFVTIANDYLVEISVYAMACDDITKSVDAISDWNVLGAEELNEVRTRLILKQNLLVAKRMFECGNQNYERLNGLYTSLLGATPYIRPNSNVWQIENMFYRTMKAMDLSFNETNSQGNEDFLVRGYRAVLNTAEANHSKSKDGDHALESVFSAAQALSWACALYMRESINNFASRLVGYSAFFSSVVATARENALVNINECKRLGIPCVMPVIRFQIAESMRDGYSSEDDADLHRFTLFENYLEASLCAKALVLCFSGQKPELNEKGYCSRVWTWDADTSTLVVCYLGVSGEPILRDGFSGYSRTFDQEKGERICWQDIKGNVVRFQSTNEFSTADYDSAGRCIRKTYCNAAWQPMPRRDGVLFETFGYDEAGNETSWEFFGAMSNHVACKDGMAIIKKRFNKRGQETSRRFYGVSGKAVNHKDGHAGFDIVYDKMGNQRKFTFVGLNGKPVMTKLGYAIESRIFNAQGKEVERTWYDEDEKLVCVDGVARIRYLYDEKGNCTDCGNFGVDDKLKRGTENYATVQWSYNSFGQAIEGRYYGPDGQPAQHRDGFASWKAVLDVSGRVSGCKYYDIEGREIIMGQPDQK